MRMSEESKKNNSVAILRRPRFPKWTIDSCLPPGGHPEWRDRAFEKREETEQIFGTPGERDFSGDVAMLQGTSALDSAR